MRSADRTVFLIGFMGSGKTTAGQRLASHLARPFHDTDRLVEQQAGRSIERIFEESGEAEFRRLEWEVLRSLDAREPAVVAAGGGLFDAPEPRRLMRRRGLTIWLQVPSSVALERVGRGAGRPLWQTRDPITFRAFFERRAAAYALAERRIDASGDPDSVVQRLLDGF